MAAKGARKRPRKREALCIVRVAVAVAVVSQMAAPQRANSREAKAGKAGKEVDGRARGARKDAGL